MLFLLIKPLALVCTLIRQKCILYIKDQFRQIIAIPCILFLSKFTQEQYLKKVGFSIVILFNLVDIL